MLHKIIGSNNLVTPFLRFTTDSGSFSDPHFLTGGTATFEWISPDGTISTGAIPNPALDQIGMYTVKCSDWSDVTRLDMRDENVTVLENLHVLPTSINQLSCQTNSISVLDISMLTSLRNLYCHSNSISILEVAALTLLLTIWCQDNGMDETNVDKILADLVTAGVNNGTANLAGTNAAPSAAGLVNKAILEGRGWTVTVSA